MEARKDILARLRASLGRRDGDGAKLRVADRIARHEANPVPARAQISHEHQVELFIDMAERADATVMRVATGKDVPPAVKDYLVAHNLPTAATMAPDPVLAGLPWHEQPMLSFRNGVAREEDAVAITSAFAAVAETGTLMVISGETHPTSLNFLPENHIVIISVDQMIGTYEEAWERLRKTCHDMSDEGFRLPRTVNLITGPSRTADIELKPTLGAHGPRRLHIVLIDRSNDGAG